MLYYKFQNYEEFKSIFGIQYHGNGSKNRKNKILLAYIKNRELLHEAVKTNDFTLLHISNIPDLKQEMKKRIKQSGLRSSKMPHQVHLNGETYYSHIYSTDKNNGLCEDGDYKAVRYINHENDGRVFKMKAGKFYRTLILETKFGKTLPEQVLIYLCEEFTTEWQSYCMGRLPKNKLHVNDDFGRIYSSEHLLESFGSCMTNRGLHGFYENAVNASAAYLENEEGKIIARCVIYNEVKDQDGKNWRLAERQYASEGNEVYKRALVDALINGGHIDGYKQIGAACSDARNFVDIHGNSLSEKEFRIACNLDWDDELSYQDSFKWYCMSSHIATNYGSGEHSLDTTEGSLNGGEYDDYHEYYCHETTTVYVNGSEYYCNVNDLSEFVWIESLDEYHHKDDVATCPVCGRYFVLADRSVSEITEECYCKNECQKKAEHDYKKENWFYSEFDDEYYENADDVMKINQWNGFGLSYHEITASHVTVNEMLDARRWFKFDGIVFTDIDENTGLPFGYCLTKCA